MLAVSKKNNKVKLVKMKRQKEIRILGYFLLFFSIFFMAYNIFKETEGDTMYIVYGSLISIIGMFLASYGEKTKN